MASLARRLAPAAALGGLAVVIVGVADPAIANLTSDASAAGVTPQAAPAPQARSQSAPQAQDLPKDAPAQQDARASGASCATGEQVTGDAVMTQWGPVQVVASVDGRSVCAVQAVSWPSSDRKSQMINSYAIPQLDAMASQDATQFDYVSGATYTSAAYHQSVQSILDRL